MHPSGYEMYHGSRFNFFAKLTDRVIDRYAADALKHLPTSVPCGARNDRFVLHSAGVHADCVIYSM